MSLASQLRVINAYHPKSQQNVQLVKHFLDFGSITAVESAAKYRIRSLHSRLAELRKLGFMFDKEHKQDILGQRYVRYHYRGHKILDDSTVRNFYTEV